MIFYSELGSFSPLIVVRYVIRDKLLLAFTAINLLLYHSSPVNLLLPYIGNIVSSPFFKNYLLRYSSDVNLTFVSSNISPLCLISKWEMITGTRGDKSLEYHPGNVVDCVQDK